MWRVIYAPHGDQTATGLVTPPRAVPATAEAASPEKRRYVRAIFSEIAPRYDLLNRILSLNVDRSWRTRAVEALEWRRSSQGKYLDACAGTLDLASELARRHGFEGKVVATDFAVPMLAQGRSKPPPGKVALAAADTLVLPFRDGVFAGATVGFGVRNLTDLEAGLRELGRVLEPGARLVVLDFARPHWAPLRACYLFYFRRILPLLGRLLSGHPTAYTYLPESVMSFPTPASLEASLLGAGFGRTGHVLLTGGIAAVIWGEK
jgi:demethylmenaquinone methyltransferase/2-methoxy-6-polyprenyl-1,4-benzoquinol methylase